jgi:hypothetical protein
LYSLPNGRTDKASSRHGEKSDAPVDEPEKALRLTTESERLETER